MKKLSALLVSICLCFTLSGCGGAKKGSDEFVAFTKDIPATLVEHNAFDVNFFFDNPETYGINLDLYTLDFMSLEDYKAYDSKLSELGKQLASYDYDALTDDQKITYDLLKDALEETDGDIEDQYYLTTNYFSISSGVQAQLIISLWNYEFKSQKSLDSFIAVLNQAPVLFKQYTDLEQTRQEKGFGMSQTYMDNVITSLTAITTSDQNYVLEATNAKIDNASFVPDDKKQAYKDEIASAFHEKLLPAFAQAKEDLAAITIQKSGDSELASYTGGKAYFEMIATNSLGVDSIKEYEDYLDKQENKLQAEIGSLLKKYPSLMASVTDMDALQKAMSNPTYTNLDNTDSLIQYLETQVNADTVFPAIDTLQYEMNELPAAMKETTTAAAAYFVSSIDGDASQIEHMIVNGTFEQKDFTMYAHESFPGHMYQHNYFKTVDHDVLRDLLDSSAFSEGWATYAQVASCDYSEDPGICHFNELNNQFTYVYIMKLDKLIHYDGYSREDAYAYLKENFGLEDEEALKGSYEQLLESPGVFINYYGSLFRIQDLQRDAKQAWGDDYSDYRFNKTILDLSGLPMDLLEKYCAF